MGVAVKWYWVAFLSLLLTGCNPGVVKTPSNGMEHKTDAFICRNATGAEGWNGSEYAKPFVREAKLRGLRCDLRSPQFVGDTDDWICKGATSRGEWDKSPQVSAYLAEAKRRGLSCGIKAIVEQVVISPQETEISENEAKTTDQKICKEATKRISNGMVVWNWATNPSKVRLALRMKINCEVSDDESAEQNPRDSIALDPERMEVLKRPLAQLEAEKNVKQDPITQDTASPSIRITSTKSDGARGTITGTATDNTGIAEVLVDGQVVPLDPAGRFTSSTFIPSGGINVQITAYDLKGFSTTETVRLERTKRIQQVSRLAKVNPLVGPKQIASRDRVALIIGVEKYARAPSADYASGDAKMFADYAREKLGVADNNIKVLSDTGASKAEVLRALKVWLPKAVKPDTTDLYVFYAGHGMPTADGSSAYLVPYDGDIQLLEDTAISRKRFFDEISATKPRSATFFFDNCFSGATRSEELLLASRPLGIKVQETTIPDNYLVFTAGETDQIAGVEPEVKHGRFSYFVFKGLEGEADANQDGKISAGELHKYVRESVGRFSAGAQTPTMLGDAGRWVLR